MSIGSPLLVYAHASEGARVAAREPDRSFALGVGPVGAAVNLSRAIAEHEPHWIFAFGLCGSFRGEGPEVGELCFVGQDGLGDVGVETPAGFRSLGELSLGDDQIFLADRARQAALLGRVPGSTVVRGVTVATGSGTDDRAQAVQRRTGAAVETMEGAAIAAAAAAAGVGWVSLRCVSNYTGDRDRGAFDLQGSCQRIQEVVLGLLEGGYL